MNATGSNQTKIFHLERVSLESSRDDILADIHSPALISQTQITPRLNKIQSPKLEQRDQKSIFCGDFGPCKVCVALGHGEVWSLSPLAGSLERKPQTRQQCCYDSPKQLKLIHCIQPLPISYCCKLAFLSTHQVRPRTMALNKLPDELVLCVVYQLTSPKKPFEFGSLQSPHPCYRYPDIVLIICGEPKAIHVGVPLHAFEAARLSPSSSLSPAPHGAAPGPQLISSIAVGTM